MDHAALQLRPFESSVQTSEATTPQPFFAINLLALVVLAVSVTGAALLSRRSAVALPIAGHSEDVEAAPGTAHAME